MSNNLIDNRRPCNCGNRTVIQGENTFNSGRVVMSPDFRNGEIHRGYPQGTSCANNIDINVINNTDINSPINICDNISDNSIIKNISIYGYSNIFCEKSWNAKEWQKENTSITDNWLPYNMPYIYNFGSLNQLPNISVKPLNNNNNGKIIWGIYNNNDRIKLSIRIDITYDSDYYINNYSINKKSIADIEIIDVGSSTSSLYTNLKTEKSVDNMYNTNIKKIIYKISWEPTLETITNSNDDLNEIIEVLKNRSKSKNNNDSRIKLKKILDNINNYISNTKLSIFIRYGIDDKKLNIMGSLISIDIINK